MPDDNTPGEQGNPHQQAPEGFVEKARFDGLVRKVEQLTLDSRSLNDQLAAKTSETEQLRAQLSVKDTEKSAAVSERDRQLQEAITSRTALETEVAGLRALQLKVETIRKLNRPDLIRIADKIPAMTDAEALESVLKEFASFADEAATAREKQLLAGVTPWPSPAPAKPLFPVYRRPTKSGTLSSRSSRSARSSARKPGTSTGCGWRRKTNPDEV